MLENYTNQTQQAFVNINGHVHTPHSFSAFSEISQIFEMATAENIKAVGINDFYTTDGYIEFAQLAKQYKIYPLFNIEFMALQQDLQKAGIKVNDPNNAGRTYFSGKGLRFPATLSKKNTQKVAALKKESNLQTFEMVTKLNSFLEEIGSDLQFDPTILMEKYAKNLFRERHIATAIREAISEKFTSVEKQKNFYTQLFSGKELKSALTDVVGIENELRGNLLKAGGTAYVEEDPKAFLSFDEVKEIIIDAGGIPCYPVLLDDPKGNFTDWENSKEQLLKTLTDNDVYSIELIPGRNDFSILKEFVLFFHKNNFVITFGTEHNTPQLDPIKITCRGGVPLDDELLNINYEGASIIAAHQYLVANGEEGYLKGTKAKMAQKEQFIELGKAVISEFTKK